uniref:Peptidase M24 domain-containing protein n=1 Tax=Piliocolobus tephrosceles TaxID=591936 RepID=A0A8C9GGG0_9PRIM
MNKNKESVKNNKTPANKKQNEKAKINKSEKKVGKDNMNGNSQHAKHDKKDEPQNESKREDVVINNERDENNSIRQNENKETNDLHTATYNNKKNCDKKNANNSNSKSSAEEGDSINKASNKTSNKVNNKTNNKVNSKVNNKNTNINSNEDANKKNKNKKKKTDKFDLILSQYKNDISKDSRKIKEEKAKEKIETSDNRIDFNLDEIEKIKKNIIFKEHIMEEQNNSHIRLLNNWPRVENSIQTNPPTIPIELVYQENNYPYGQILDYKHVLSGQSLQEKKELEKINLDYYDDLRKAAECHRQVRKYIQSYVKPGRKMIDIVQETEKKTKELILSHKLKCGWGFPTGCSLNHCAAHYTPNYGDETVLKYDDVCKLDFGVHVNGCII